MGKCSTYKMLKKLSADTWERIGFVRTSKGLKVYETTITQNILYEFKKFSEVCGNDHIEVYEATDESIYGNDIEICIKMRAGYIKLPTQAKILYKSGRYDKIRLNGKNGGLNYYLFLSLAK